MNDFEAKHNNFANIFEVSGTSYIDNLVLLWSNKMQANKESHA